MIAPMADSDCATCDCPKLAHGRICLKAIEAGLSHFTLDDYTEAVKRRKQATQEPPDGR